MCCQSLAYCNSIHLLEAFIQDHSNTGPYLEKHRQVQEEQDTSHTQCYQDPNRQPAFGLWEETSVPRGSPLRCGKNMPHMGRNYTYTHRGVMLQTFNYILFVLKQVMTDSVQHSRSLCDLQPHSYKTAYLQPIFSESPYLLQNINII